ncbi:hypothetical protein GE061_015834 [Apolygus lucorum]|uniref:Uncharacterized protein n=1 Tax=Apolygus lucorum TaxID=248454 RepID=A0A8S9XPC3_APOLU|nr:hypothetical protein GE061_015834 [Apolygus lucorum]
MSTFSPKEFHCPLKKDTFPFLAVLTENSVPLLVVISGEACTPLANFLDTEKVFSVNTGIVSSGKKSWILHDVLLPHLTDKPPQQNDRGLMRRAEVEIRRADPGESSTVD